MGKSIELLAKFSMGFAAKSSTDFPTTPFFILFFLFYFYFIFIFLKSYEFILYLTTGKLRHAP